jgi:hypothetical protein
MQVGTLIGLAKQGIVAYLPEVGDFFLDIAAPYITLPDPAEYDQLAGTPLFVPDRHNPNIAQLCLLTGLWREPWPVLES